MQDPAKSNVVIRRSFTKPGQTAIASITFCEKPKVVYTNLVDGVHKVFILGGQLGDRYFNLVYELVNRERGYHAQV